MKKIKRVDDLKAGMFLYCKSCVEPKEHVNMFGTSLKVDPLDNSVLYLHAYDWPLINVDIWDPNHNVWITKKIVTIHERIFYEISSDFAATFRDAPQQRTAGSKGQYYIEQQPPDDGPDSE